MLATGIETSHSPGALAEGAAALKRKTHQAASALAAEA